jgi:hydrogenase maturation protease
VTRIRTLVIGYGNPLRQDDGIGIRAAELLAKRLPPGNAEIIQCHQLTPELAAEIAESALVVFLDAACDLEPGMVFSTSVLSQRAGAWSHHLSPAQLLGLSEQVCGNGPPAILIRGGIQASEFGESLTSLGEQTATRMADEAQALLLRTG